VRERDGLLVSVVIGGVQVRNNWAHMEKDKKTENKTETKVYSVV
jgi:hypothetical protein